jgi:hypothetical protein
MLLFLHSAVVFYFRVPGGNSIPKLRKQVVLANISEGFGISCIRISLAAMDYLARGEVATKLE